MTDKMIPDISVIVTVYNIEKYISECLESILSQKGPTLECICVDDASTDGSLEILNKYALKDPRIKIIQNQKNMGLSSSRNIGFRNAMGKYLYNIDGDDFLEVGALERLFSCAEKNKLDLLGFSATSFFESEKMEKFGKEDEYVREKIYPQVMTGAELFAELIRNNDRASSNMVLYFYRRKYFESNNLYGVEKLRYADDSMFAMYMAAQRAMCIPDRLYMRRYREGSTCTSEMKKYYMESLIVLFIKELQVWEKYNFDNELNSTIEKYFNTRLISIKAMYKKFHKDNTDTPLLNKNIMAKYFYKYFIAEELLYKNFLTAEEFSKLKNINTIILYGAGCIANEVAKALEYNKILQYMVVVTDKGTEHNKFRGKEIVNINDLKCDKKNAVVIVAMSKNNYDAVTAVLEQLGYHNVIWASL